MRTLELIEQFNTMKALPYFEIEPVEGSDDWVLYTIQVDGKGVYTNLYMPRDDKDVSKLNQVYIEWDDHFSLDAHLEGLYDYCANDAYQAANLNLL